MYIIYIGACTHTSTSSPMFIIMLVLVFEFGNSGIQSKFTNAKNMIKSVVREGTTSDAKIANIFRELNSRLTFVFVFMFEFGNNEIHAKDRIKSVVREGTTSEAKIANTFRELNSRQHWLTPQVDPRGLWILRVYQQLWVSIPDTFTLFELIRSHGTTWWQIH
jgi:hypothetical protein